MSINVESIKKLADAAKTYVEDHKKEVAIAAGATTALLVRKFN
jgi:hypothetical protein